MTGMGGSHDPTPNDAGESMSAAREPLAPDAIEHLTAEIYEDANGQGWHSATSAEQAEYRAKVKRWLSGVSSLRAPQSGPQYPEMEALIGRVLPRYRVILAARPDDPERIDHIERHDVMVIPKEDWIQVLIWLAVLRAGSGAETPPQPETKP